MKGNKNISIKSHNLYTRLGPTIERTVGKLKRFTCVARRCEKTALNYASFVALALGFILTKSVV